MPTIIAPLAETSTKKSDALRGGGRWHGSPVSAAAEARRPKEAAADSPTNARTDGHVFGSALLDLNIGHFSLRRCLMRVCI